MDTIKTERTNRKKYNIRKTLLIQSTVNTAFGMGFTKTIVPSVKAKLIKEDIKAVKKFKNRRLRLKRIPSIYLSNNALESLSEAKVSVDAR